MIWIAVLLLACYDDDFALHSLSGRELCDMAYSWKTFKLGLNWNPLHQLLAQRLEPGLSGCSRHDGDDRLSRLKYRVIV
jgi:hypothetical protein